MPNLDLQPVLDLEEIPNLDLEPIGEDSAHDARRIKLLGEIEAARKEGTRLDADLAETERQERSISNFTGSGLVNLPGKIAANLAGYGDTFEPTRGPLVPISVPADDPSALAGVGRVGASLLSGLTDPDVFVTLPAFGGGAIPKFLGSAAMAQHLPEQVEQGARIAGDINSTPAQVVEGVLNPVVTGAMLGGIAHTKLPVRGEPGYVGEVPEIPRAPDPLADLKARNIASPGTLRPQEIQAVGLDRPPEPPFSIGNLPFNDARRFGNFEVPPPDILPRMGRLNEPIIDAELRTKEELSGGGKASFAAPAPELLRQAQISRAELEAIEGAQAVGLTRTAKALEDAKNARIIKDAETQTQPSVGGAGEPVVRNADVVQERLQGAPERPAAEAPPSAEIDQVAAMPHQDFVKWARQQKGGYTTKAYELGEKMQTPEGAAKLRELEAQTEAARLAAFAAEDIEAAMNLANKKQFFTEALESAVGVAKNKSNLTPEQVAKAKAAPAIVAEKPPSVPESAAIVPENAPIVAQTPDIVSRLEQIRDRFDASGDMGKSMSLPHPDAFKAIGKSVIYTAVDLAIQAVKAGRAIGDAINLALDHVRKNHNGELNEKELRANLDYLISNETKPKAVPTAPTTAGAPTPAPTAAGTGRPLSAVEKIFQPEPKPTITTKGVVAAVGSKASTALEKTRGGLSSKYRPVNKLVEDIAKQSGGKTPQDAAAVFEQLAGAERSAEPAVFDFNNEVSKPVGKDTLDFNSYMFISRSLDRLRMDAKDIARAMAGEEVKGGLNRRNVGDFTIPELESQLSQWREKVGPKRAAELEKAGEAYQRAQDKALREQVDSGRMSQEVYDAIKDENAFYAPFRLLKYMEATAEGGGKRIDTRAEYTKAMTGIGPETQIKLGDMIEAGRQNIVRSRVLAQKNRAMQQIGELAKLDKDGSLVRKLKEGEESASAVTVFEDGKPERYSVPPEVAEVLQKTGNAGAPLIFRWGKNLLTQGATGLNLAFQPVNLISADQMRAGLISKYGIKGASDFVRYPMDFASGLLAAIEGQVSKLRGTDISASHPVDIALRQVAPDTKPMMSEAPNRLYRDFVESMAAGGTKSEFLNPKVLFEKPSLPKRAAKGTLDTLSALSQAIEETTKIATLKRAMRMEGVERGTQLGPQAVKEVRRFGGSVDFSRMGSWTENFYLNTFLPFFNPRTQGALLDTGRLLGKDGAKTAATTWLRVGTAVGVPTVALWLRNHSSKELEDDYNKRPLNERENYWLIPKDNFITAENGERIRDYWRIPKREMGKVAANTMEAAMQFARTKDPKTFGKWADDTINNLSPINFGGRNLPERVESAISSVNPAVKLPIEQGMNRDSFRHRNIIPDELRNVDDPTLQVRPYTAEVWQRAADAMPKWSPDVFRSPLRIEHAVQALTAGLFTQFIPDKPLPGRPALGSMENALTKRFRSVPWTNDEEFREEMQKLKGEAASIQARRTQAAQGFVSEHPGKDEVKFMDDFYRKHPMREGDTQADFEANKETLRLRDRAFDLFMARNNGVGGREKQILSLPVQQRAQWVMNELKKAKDDGERERLMNQFTYQRIITTPVMESMNELWEQSAK